MKSILKKPEILMIALSVIVVAGITAFVVSHGFSERMKKSTEKPQNTETVEEQKLTEKDSSAVITAVGNCSLDSSIINSLHMLDGSYNFSAPFEKISSDLKESDLALINLSSVISTSSDNGINNIPAEAASGMVDAGFNTFFCANSKFLSTGKTAINIGADILSEIEGVNRLGINKNEQESKELTICYKNGISIALLNYTNSAIDSPLSDSDRYMVNILEQSKAVKDIKNAKKLAEVVIVYIDWDISYQAEPDESQERYVTDFCKAGADVIIGAGTTTVQPVKWVEDKESKHKTLVYYSLGNFLTGSADTVSLTGLMAKFTITRKDGVVTIGNESATPVFTHYDKDISNYCVYKLSDYSDELAKEHFIYSGESFTVDSLRKSVKDTVGDYIN